MYFDRHQGNDGKDERTAENGDTSSARANMRLSMSDETNKSEAARLLFRQVQLIAQTPQENTSSKDQRAHEHSDIFLCLFVLPAEMKPHCERGSAAGGALPQNCPEREGADPVNRPSGRWNPRMLPVWGSGNRDAYPEETDLELTTSFQNTS